MKRRTVLGVIAGSSIVASAGCIGQAQEDPSDPTTGDSESTPTFELVDPELDVDDPPEIDEDDDGTVIVRGTVRYASSHCGTVRLAHAEYERSQDQLNLLVIAADDSVDAGCDDDIGVDGYRIEVDGEDQPRYVAVTEHHFIGETRSTVVDLASDQSRDTETGIVDEGEE